MTHRPRIILGLMTFGPDPNSSRITSLDAFKTSLDLFQGRGYNEVDTARLYGGGKQENWSKQAGWKERGLSIATKVFPFTPGAHGADAITQHFNTCLHELGADCIDVRTLSFISILLYAVSHPREGLGQAYKFISLCQDRSVPYAETLEAVDKLHKAGKFKQFGLSNFASFEVAEIVMTCKYNGWVRPTIYQGVYSCLLRSIEPELIPTCRRYGIDIVIFSPIAGGLLSGSIQSRDAIPDDGRFSNRFLNGASRARYWNDSTFNALQAIREAADKQGISMTELALRWMVHHSKLDLFEGNDGIIIGASSLQHLESNLDDLEKGPLPDDVVQALDKAWLVAKPEATPYWNYEIKYGYDTVNALFGAEAK